MPVLVGTSGWQYKHWNNGVFYPREVAAGAQLAFYAERFQIVEVNFTFYRLPEAPAFRSWAEQTPDDFLFDIKASRFLTHFKKLKEPEEPIERLMSRARELGAKLRVVLLQLPPNFPCNLERLDRVLSLLSGQARVAVEPRHESWFTDEVREILTHHGASLCLADRGAQMITPAWRTAPWGYFRFHGGTASPPGCYHRETLEERAALLADLWGPEGEIHVFFNNDWHACALRDAAWFADAARRRGLAVTRVAAPEEARVG